MTQAHTTANAANAHEQSSEANCDTYETVIELAPGRLSYNEATETTLFADGSTLRYCADDDEWQCVQTPAYAITETKES